MAHKKHTIKTLRQDAKRRDRNRQTKSTMRTAIKKVRATVAAGDAPAAEKELQSAISVIGKTARKGAIHKRTASRLQSRLTKQINKVKAEKPAK